MLKVPIFVVFQSYLSPFRCIPSTFNTVWGVLYISTPNKSMFSNICDPAWILIGHRHYSVNNIIKYGEEAGFTIESYSIKGGWWEIVSINILYICKWIFRKPLILKDFFNKKLDAEYNKEKGFTNIFIKFAKN